MDDAFESNGRYVMQGDLAAVFVQEKKITMVHWMRAFSLNSPRGRIAACAPDPCQRSAWRFLCVWSPAGPACRTWDPPDECTSRFSRMVGISRDPAVWTALRNREEGDIFIVANRRTRAPADFIIAREKPRALFNLPPLSHPLRQSRGHVTSTRYILCAERYDRCGPA